MYCSIWGTIIGPIKGGSRSLDYGSYVNVVLRLTGFQNAEENLQL